MSTPPRLPGEHGPYTDVYFRRTRDILLAEGLDPVVTMQVFVREGPGTVHGLDEAVAMLRAFAGHGASRLMVHALAEGAPYAPGETLLTIDGPLVDFVELETLYLGAITAATSQAAGIAPPDPEAVRRRCAQVRELLPDKNLMYFGARHWHWSVEEALCAAAVAGGFDSCATDAGARAAGQSGGVGTIPHALVLAMAEAHGERHATREAALAFDRHIDPAVPRVALVDTFNREIADSLDTARALGSRLWGVRTDTAGENLGEGAPASGPRFEAGPGVTVGSVRALRRGLDGAGFEAVNIVVSSGFGDLDKVRAFAAAERRDGRLFEAVGLGGLYPARIATADVVRVNGRDLAKTGRRRRDNPRLARVL